MNYFFFFQDLCAVCKEVAKGSIAWRGHAKPTVREIQVELRERDRETKRNEDSSCWCTIFDFKCKFFLNVMPTKVQLTKYEIDWQAKEKKLWKKAQLNNSYKICYSQLQRRERESLRKCCTMIWKWGNKPADWQLIRKSF